MKFWSIYFSLPSQNEGKGALVQAHGYMHHIIFIPLCGKEHEVFPQGGGEAKLQHTALAL